MLWAITRVTKKFKIEERNIKQLIVPIGGCMATDKITIDGELVDFMYRDIPDYEHNSGWRSLSGTETQDYADSWAIYDFKQLLVARIQVAFNFKD